MDNNIEDIMKSVIHIDKGACIMKQDVYKQIEQRRTTIEEEVENIRKSVVEGRRSQAEAKKVSILHNTQQEAEKILSQANNKTCAMEMHYKEMCEKFTKDIFTEIFSGGKAGEA